MNCKEIGKYIEDCVSDDLLDKKWLKYKKQHPNKHKLFGHCYVVSEAAYHLLGGKEQGWTPQHVKVCGVPHWFLKHKNGTILDLTANQFRVVIPYDKARGTGFLTKRPSKRAVRLMGRILNAEILFSFQ